MVWFSSSLLELFFLEYKILFSKILFVKSMWYSKIHCFLETQASTPTSVLSPEFFCSLPESSPESQKSDF